MSSSTFGLIVGNRGFFPVELAQKGRLETIKVIEGIGHKVIVLDEKETTYGTVGTYGEAKKCAELFRSHASGIDGIIVVLPNFGDEKSAADAIRLSGLRVPVLVQASPDDPEKMEMGQRRDSFCGKISLCNNLKQYGIKFSLTRLHTCGLKSEEFKNDIQWFSSVCRVVKGLSNARIGAIGARPADFNTVRYSEKLLERQGISVETIDLSEILVEAQLLKDRNPDVIDTVAEIKKYVDTSTNEIPDERLTRMAKLYIVLKGWINENRLRRRGYTMLDIHGGELWCRSLHCDVDAEPELTTCCLRSGCDRGLKYACITISVGSSPRFS